MPRGWTNEDLGDLDWVVQAECRRRARPEREWEEAYGDAWVAVLRSMPTWDSERMPLRGWVRMVAKRAISTWNKHRFLRREQPCGSGMGLESDHEGDDVMPRTPSPSTCPSGSTSTGRHRSGLRRAPSDAESRTSPPGPPPRPTGSA
jgi:DNA-directed RNA polymerase specialized sigma24 family protein